MMMDARRDIAFICFVAIWCIIASQECHTCRNGDCTAKGQCNQGCVNGYADKYCDYQCQSNCQNSKCTVNDNGQTVCSSGCIDRYCGSRCKVSCPPGCLQCSQLSCKNCTKCADSRYGEDCKYSCKDKCNGYACNTSGQCEEFCIDGMYGKNCSIPCKLECKTCNRTTGKCIKCTEGYYGDLCEKNCTVYTKSVDFGRSTTVTTPQCINGCDNGTNRIYDELSTLKKKLQSNGVALYCLITLVILLILIVVVWLAIKVRTCRKKVYQGFIKTEIHPIYKEEYAF